MENTRSEIHSGNKVYNIFLEIFVEPVVESFVFFVNIFMCVPFIIFLLLSLLSAELR